MIRNDMMAAVQYEIYQLKSYAIQTREGSRDRPYTDREQATHCLCAALIKDQAESFEPIVEQKEVVEWATPLNWFEHLKLALPAELQFGWLRPVLEDHSREVTTSTIITINSYSVYEAPAGSDSIRIARMPKFDRSLSLFRSVDED